MITDIIDFSKLAINKKFSLMMTSLDLIFICFSGFITSKNIGINIPELYFSSTHTLAVNLFSVQTFVIIIIIVLFMILYYIAIPFFFPIFFYRIMQIIYGAIHLIYSLFMYMFFKIFKNQKIIVDLSLETDCRKYKMFDIDEDGNLIQNEKTKILIYIFDDISGDCKMEELYIKIFRIALFAFIIGLNLCLGTDKYYWVLYILGTLTLLPLGFASVFFNLQLRINEFRVIIRKLRLSNSDIETYFKEKERDLKKATEDNKSNYISQL